MSSGTSNIFIEPLSSVDPEVSSLLNEELKRQRDGIELIASENFTSLAVLECLGSVATNKYAEGQVGKRYYGGNEVIDKLEQLAKDRALTAFGLDPAAWGVNVQPYSGSVANAAVYLGLLKPGERLMGLDLPSGGHLTHGYRTPTKAISSSAAYYDSTPYKIGADGRMDYDEIEELVVKNQPRLIICGASAYPYDINYGRLRTAADKVGAYLMADIAHISGFVATGLMNSPFEFCDVVTTTTHKTLRGPRAGMIFYRKPLETQLDMAVFPGLQGGPHENQIAAIATQMLSVAKPSFKEYMTGVRTNADALIKALRDRGYTVTDSENHLFLMNCGLAGLTGAQAERALEAVGISVNKNMIYGDTSALNPTGIRIGTPAVTSRGLGEADMDRIADFIDRTFKVAVQIVRGLKELHGAKIPVASLIEAYEGAEIFKTIRTEVREFMTNFPFYA